MGNMGLIEPTFRTVTSGGESLYDDNNVRTTKYTKMNFVPKNLMEQFSRMANVYFLIIVSGDERRRTGTKIWGERKKEGGGRMDALLRKASFSI